MRPDRTQGDAASKVVSSLAIGVLLFMMSGCGQKGPLTMVKPAAAPASSVPVPSPEATPSVTR